jgi:hypothetical protein
MKKGAELALLRLAGSLLNLARRMFAIVTVVIVVVPVAVGAPPMTVFIPPTVGSIPAAFTCFAQLLASVIGLPAVAAMMLDSFVQFVIRLRDTALATVVGAQARRAGEEQEPR